MGTTYRMREPERPKATSSSARTREDSGAYSTVAQPAPDEFAEPDLDLVSLAERKPEQLPSDLLNARKLLQEQERRIAALEQQLAAYSASTPPDARQQSSIPAAAPGMSAPLPGVSTPPIEIARSPAAAVADSAATADVLTTLSFDEAPAKAGFAPAPAPHAPMPDADFEAYPTLKRLSLSTAMQAAAERAQSSPPPSQGPNEARESAVPSSRRRNQRLALELELEFTEDTHFYAGITQDLSQGGVFVATYRVLPVGTHLWLSFDLPDGTHVHTRGEVRWIREQQEGSLRPGMGVAFCDLPELALGAIQRFCRGREPLYIEL